MGTIELDSGLLTLVNVFSCQPEDQDRIVAMLADETERHISRLPGFVAAHIHRSTDGLRVVNYAQWRSAGEWRAMFEDPEIRAAVAAVEAISRPDVHEYEVVHVLGPPAPAGPAPARPGRSNAEAQRVSRPVSASAPVGPPSGSAPSAVP